MVGFLTGQTVGTREKRLRRVRFSRNRNCAKKRGRPPNQAIAKVELVSSHRNETKLEGRPPNQAIAKIMLEQSCSRAAAYRILARRKARQRSLREKLLAETLRFSSLIKPTDKWDFAVVHYPRIDDAPESHGYIPGDLYANCLFYFARTGDLVVAPMAGSGQIHHVWLDRAVWTKGLPQPWNVELRMFDLAPRGRYASLISRWNMLNGFPPLDRAPDYVVMDVPYLGECVGQYSDQPDDIANMGETGWSDAMRCIARSCAEATARRCTVIVPTWVDTDKTRVVLCPEIVRDAWRAVGYRLHRVCYASKRIQAARTDRIAVLNNRAKATCTPLSDMIEVLTFDRERLKP